MKTATIKKGFSSQLCFSNAFPAKNHYIHCLRVYGVRVELGGICMYVYMCMHGSEVGI